MVDYITLGLNSIGPISYFDPTNSKSVISFWILFETFCQIGENYVMHYVCYGRQTDDRDGSRRLKSTSRMMPFLKSKSDTTIFMTKDRSILVFTFDK